MDAEAAQQKHRQQRRLQARRGKQKAEAPAAEEPAAEAPAASADGGKVYYLAFKPEVDTQWQEIAAAYTAETGVEVKVVTAASGTYEEVLRSEIAGTDAPTLFQINGPVGYQNWKDYCLDLTNSELYNALSDKGLAVTGADGGVYGVPYTVEAYGIITTMRLCRHISQQRRESSKRR